MCDVVAAGRRGYPAGVRGAGRPAREDTMGTLTRRGLVRLAAGAGVGAALGGTEGIVGVAAAGPGRGPACTVYKPRLLLRGRASNRWCARKPCRLPRLRRRNSGQSPDNLGSCC